MTAIAVIGNRPQDQYFRWPMLEAARRRGIEAIYGHWHGPRRVEWSDAAGGVRRESIAGFARRHRSRLDALVVGIGLRRPWVGGLLRLVARPRLLAWDYYDDLFYGDRSFRRRAVSRAWAASVDRVLVLQASLAPRFANASVWGNASHVAPRPPAPGAPRTVGVIASLDRRFDRALYESVVRAEPDMDFVLHGRLRGDEDDWRRWLEPLEARPNFRYLGPYGSRDVESIVHSFDVGWIPYRVDASTEHINPDKAYHYASAGLHVVSTPFPAMRGRPGVHLASEPGKTLDVLAAIRAGRFPTPEPIACRWEDRLDELLGFVAERGRS